MGLQRQVDSYTGPANVLGIEINEYAAELARVTVWIGELQWRLQHGYPFKVNPVLDPLDQIECRDALLDADGSEAAWPRVSVVIGNPPFVGGGRKRRELGDEYFAALDRAFAPRVPGACDLVCYWFDKARSALMYQGLGAAGLVATNSIRGGANRKVLEAIAGHGKIFDAWGDEAWINEGAAMRVSLVCFGHGDGARLNGQHVPEVYADLTAPSSANRQLDLSLATVLRESRGHAMEGMRKDGPFDVDGVLARSWLSAPNVHGIGNAAVLLPRTNGRDFAARQEDGWVIDFGVLPLQDARMFEKPFAYVEAVVRPERELNRDRQRREKWWLFGRSNELLRGAMANLPRVIATVRHSKFRFFRWIEAIRSPDTALVVVARADDATLGLLHGRPHELWSIRMGTSIGVGNDPRYTPSSCFDTFPFPAGLTPADTAHQRTEAVAPGTGGPHPDPLQGPRSGPFVANGEGTVQIPADLGPAVRAHAIAIGRAAKRLDDLRERWLNPPEWTRREPEVVPLGMDVSPYPDRILPRDGFEKQLAQRTLTKLYNERPAWLAQAHESLDAAVAAAYGWPDYSPQMPDEEIVRRLLALNRERAGS